ncbi:MAG TPA: hypothetical protein VFR81_01800 [Longimicrobium sp.]|nr:hypothetical protein [Longimicrobium sp.]
MSAVGVAAERRGMIGVVARAITIRVMPDCEKDCAFWLIPIDVILRPDRL